MVLSWWLDFRTLEVLSNLNDSLNPFRSLLRIPFGIPFQLLYGNCIPASQQTLSLSLKTLRCHQMWHGDRGYTLPMSFDRWWQCISHLCLLHVVTHHYPDLFCFPRGGVVETLSGQQQGQQHTGILEYLCPFLAIPFLFLFLEARVQFLHWLQRLRDTSCNCWQV